eukprot:TRINITY_DN3190_c0_g1_i1.p1 TRINITY_DN3190_c0_g1~~TRINITY_DN3190_c0_g1_i1.p1  ORF type:complete len:415 (+),score=84.17 TRINITY_DN3190_c0_g1_i1:39-1247(+)
METSFDLEPQKKAARSCRICSKPTYEKIVRKEGPNKGRPFFSCCDKYFEWADLEVSTQSSTALPRIIYKAIRKSDASFDTPPKEFPPHYRGISKGQRIHIVPLRNEAQVIFEYDHVLVDAIKEYVKGRRFDQYSKSWFVPFESLDELVELLRYMGVFVPLLIAQIAKDHKQKGDVITLAISPMENDIEVDFLYNPDIIASIKQIHPRRRTWNDRTKKWTVSLKALPDLLECLGHPNDLEVTDEHLLELSKEIAEKNIEEEEMNLASMPSSQSSQPTQSAPAASSPVNQSPQKFTANLNLTSPNKRKREEETAGCNCGKPWQKVDGIHICRYYGHFNCGNCNNKWTSGWTWKGETQACRKCGRESNPYQCDPLKSDRVDNSQGPHDEKRCGMCRKLGKACNSL